MTPKSKKPANATAPKPVKVPQPGSALEATLLMQIRAARLPEPTLQYRFAAPERRWALDFAWVDARCGVEVMGSTWAAGRHTRGAGYAADAEKANAALLRGWFILRVTREHVESGQALAWVETLLGRVGATVKIA